MQPILILTMTQDNPSEPDSTFVLQIAITSDLHAYVSTEIREGGTPSNLEVLSADTSSTTNPILGLRELITSLHLRADILLCPGDLGDKASPQGIQFAWQKVHEIGSWLGVAQVLATTGNHDVDSRFKDHEVDPSETIKNLDPPYPTPLERDNDAYFARDFVVVDGENYRLVLLNSSAHHGTLEQEMNHGRVTATTIGLLRKKLISSTPKPVSILLCHHHPHHHSELQLGSTDVMKDGQLLLDLLGSDAGAPWLVIHGHKHHPKITYAAGGTSSPVVFASGSLCAELFRELQTATKNQFHLLTLRPADIQQYGLVGTIESWYWSYGNGWQPSQIGSGLPRRCGFGFRGDLNRLARNIEKAVGDDIVRWTSLTDKLPELSFLLPQDFQILKGLLDRKHNIGIQDEDGLAVAPGSRNVRSFH